jgi:hypothetical protein
MSNTSVTNITNLTPHTINETNSGLSFAPSGVVARVSVENIERNPFWVTLEDSVPMFQQVTGEVQDLPEFDGTMYIVSAMVRLACPERSDLLSPGQLVRNDEGQPIGCDGFVFN